MSPARGLLPLLLVLVLLVPTSFGSSPHSDGADPAPQASSGPGVSPPMPLGSPGPEKPIARPPLPTSSSESGGNDPTDANLDLIRDRHGFAWPWGQGIRGAGVNLAVVEDGVDFGHPDLDGTEATVTDPASPYFGWPLAYDPTSVATYLTTNETAGTWLANTSLTGSGPFEEAHTIVVDGLKDFGDAEVIAADPRDEVITGNGGDKEDFDLTDLYVTRDADNMYFGWSSWTEARNASLTLLIDVDNETGGSQFHPEGKLVDTNTSHADIVTDIAFSPDGTRVATTGADRLVRVWNVATGLVELTLAGHTGVPTSVAWSPDGNRIATADAGNLLVWNSLSGVLQANIDFLTGGTALPLQNGEHSGKVHFNPTNSNQVAVSANKYIHLFDLSLPSPYRWGWIWVPGNWDVNAVRFSPNGAQIAAAVGSNDVAVFDLNATNIQSSIPSPAAFPAYLLTAAAGGHTQPVVDLAWSPDSSKIVSGGWDGVVLWNVPGRTAIQKRADHGSRVAAVAFSPSPGTSVVSVSVGLGATLPSIRTWDATTGNPVVSLDQPRALNGVDWSFLNQIGTAASDMSGRIWAPGPPITLVKILIAHLPDYALVARGTSISDGLGGYLHRTEPPTLYTWSGSAWTGQLLSDAGGVYGFAVVPGGLFSEFSIPRAALGDPLAVSLLLVSTGDNVSRAQDTVPSDPNVAHKGLDFSPVFSHVGAFVYRRAPAYIVSGITSLSANFHFGFHPSPILQRRYGALGVLVADTTIAGEYDRVFVDLNNDKTFDPSDARMDRTNPVGNLDDFDPGIPGPGQDGYADVSAGMLYFIANGLDPIPYTDVVLARHLGEVGYPASIAERIPRNADLVAFIGEFKLDPVTDEKEEHGTKIASVLVAQGNLPQAITGTATDAKLLAIGNGQANPTEAWYFAVQGYDGIPGTGDEAQIVLTPFNAPTTREDGFDALSRTLDYIAYQVGGGRSLFVVSAGDNGFGYGTVASPAAAAAALAVGNVADYADRTAAYGGSTEGLNPQFGDVAMTSARGPVPLGVVKPEIVAAGRGNLDIPLHSAPDGSNARTSVAASGTDIAAAVVAGAGALLYQAYSEATGNFPDMATARCLLMAGADDLSQDPLSQGAGLLNATRSVRLALDGDARDALAGLIVDNCAWIPGGFRGNSYDAFTRLMFPGNAASQTFTVKNAGNAATTVALSDAVFRKTGEYVLTNLTTRDALAPTGSIVFWVNASGVSKADLATFTAIQQVPPTAGLWANADLIKVTAYAPYPEFVQKTSETAFSTNYTYNLKAWDWQWSGLPFPLAGIPLTTDLNLLAETAHKANVLEVRVHQPAARLHDGLVVHLEIPDAGDAIPDQPWTFTVEFYERQDWSWVTLDKSSLALAADTPGTFTATMTVPAGTSLGTYEGEILLFDAARGLTTTIPVLVNVAGNSPNIVLGGNPATSDLYDNHRVYAGYDHKLVNSRISRPYLGDWRYFYFDMPSTGMFGGAGFKMMADVVWGDVPSDLDIQVHGTGAVDKASDAAPARYGPYTLRLLGKTEESDRPDMKTVTKLNEDVLTWDLSGGLNVVSLHANILNGTKNHEVFGGRAGWVRADSSLTVVTNDLASQAELEFMSSFDLPDLRGSAVGPATSQVYTDVPIWQEWNNWAYPSFTEHIARAWFTYIVHVEKALIFEVHMLGQGDVGDADMGVFRQSVGTDCTWDPALVDPVTGAPGYWTGCELGKKDPTKIQQNKPYLDPFVGETSEFLSVDCRGGVVVGQTCGGGQNVNYDADGDADERVKWFSPLDGFYFIKVLGFTVNAAPGHFDLSVAVTLATGKGYQIVESDANQIIAGTAGGLSPFVPILYHLAWDFPGDTEDGGYGGAILLGTTNAPGIIVIGVNVIIDTLAPTFTDVTISVDSGFRTDTATGNRVNDPTPGIIVTVADESRRELDTSRFSVSLDGADATGLALISAPVPNPGGGRPQGTVIFNPPPLADGVHLIQVVIGDRAGNLNTLDIPLVIDRTAPILLLDPAATHIAAPTATVSGQSSPGAWIQVGGQTVQAGASGRFRVDVPLGAGTNRLEVTATDWFELDGTDLLEGNSARASLTLVSDLMAPVFTLAPYSARGDRTAADVAEIVGRVTDPASSSETLDPAAIRLVIGGSRVPVRADGSFAAFVTLVSGVNDIDVVATDRAGNEAVASVVVTRDTSAPTLALAAPVPSRVSTSTVTIAGTVETGAQVTVNGRSVTVTAGAFSTDVALSPGLNQIEVSASDGAGNVNTIPLSVVYETPLKPAGLSPLTVGLAAALAALGGIALGFLLSRMGGGPKGPETAAPAGAPSPPEPAPESPPTSEAEAPTEPAPEDPRVARLKKALDDGKITQDVYEQNLRKLQQT